MATLADLATRMKKIESDLPERVSQLTIDTAISLTEQLAAVETPVDTSKALSNWQVGVEERPSSYLPANVLGKFGSTRSASASEAVAKAKAALSGRKLGQLIYLSNNAPYIRRLAYEGYSKQAPPGWVENSVLLARRLARSIGSRLLKGL